MEREVLPGLQNPEVLMGLQPLIQSVMKGFPGLVTIVEGHMRGSSPMTSQSRGPLSCSRDPPPVGCPVSFDGLATLMSHMQSSYEAIMNRDCVNIPVVAAEESPETESSSVSQSNRQNQSPETDGSQNSSVEATGDDNISRCRNNNSNWRNNSSCRNNSGCRSRGNHPWQTRVKFNGCDQVKAFTESGVLKVEGRQKKEGRTIEVRHVIPLPPSVKPEMLRATLNSDGLVIVSQRETGVSMTDDGYAMLTNVQEGGRQRRWKRNEQPEGEKDDGKIEKREESVDQDSLAQQTENSDNPLGLD